MTAPGDHSQTHLMHQLVHSPMGAVVVAQSDLSLLFLNPVLLKALGHSSAPAAAKPSALSELFPVSDLTEISKLLNKGGSLVSHPTDLFCQDGSLCKSHLISQHTVFDGQAAWILWHQPAPAPVPPAAAAVADSKQPFQEVFQVSPIAMMLTNVEGRILAANPAVSEMLGYSEPELLTLNWRDVSHPDDTPQSEEIDRQINAGDRTSANLEKRFVKKHGETLWVRLTCTAIQDEQNNFMTCLNQLQDITDLKKSQSELELSNRRLLDFAEIASDWYWETDENLRYSHLSDSLFSYSKVRQEDLIGKTRAEISLWQDGWQRPKEWAELEELERARKSYRDFEYASFGPNGQSFHMSISGKPRYSEDGKFLGYRGTATNITHRKEMERQLLEKSAWVNIALDNMSQGISMIDWDLNLQFCNKKFLELLDFPEALGVPGTPMDSFFRFNAERGEYGPGDVEEQVQERLITAKRFEGHSFERTRPDGKVLHIEGHSVPGLGFVSTYTDVTFSKTVEQELAKQSELFETALNSIDQGFVFWGEDLRILVCNNQVGEFLDVPQEVLKPGLSFLDLVRHLARSGQYGDVDPEEFVKTKFQKAVEDGQLIENQWPFTTKDGRELFVRRYKAENFGWITTFTDITDVVSRERSAQLLSEAIESFSDSVMLLSPDEKVVYTNDRYHEIYPFSPPKDKIQGTSLEDLFRCSLEHGQINHPLAKSDPERWLNTRLAERRSQKEGMGETIHVNGLHYLYKFRQTTEGGQILVQTDITERKTAELNLQASETRLRNILESSPFGVAIVRNDNSERVYTNPKFNEMFSGKSDQSMIATEIIDSWINPEELLEFQRLAREQNWHFDIEAHRKTTEGKPWWVLMSSRSIDLDGVPAHMVWHYDVTERKLAEEEIARQRDELETLNNQKDRFFSIIAHDLKGPFNALLGFTSIMASMAETASSAEMGRYAGLVHESSKQVFALLENLLDWSRLQMGRMEIDLVPVDVTSEVDSTLSLLAPVAQLKGITLNNHCTGNLLAKADSAMLNTTLRNLINNAVKFTSQGGTVSVTGMQQGAVVSIEIADTGIGMAAEKVAGLFHLDQPTSAVGTQGETGTGLGLYLCKELIEKQGGSIEVESQKGVGSVFRVKLPAFQGLSDENPNQA